MPNGYTLSTTGIYQWADDSNVLNFIYVYWAAAEQKLMGNLCNYSLLSGQINCPTQGLGELQGNSIIGYDISLDQKTIYFCLSTNSIMNDFAAIQTDALINRKGELITTWIGTYVEEGPRLCSMDILWRPLR